MLRLNLKNTPQWLDFGAGLRLQLRPATSSLMAEARRDPLVASLVPEEADEASLAALEAARQDDLGVALAKAVARRCVLAWEGVGDEDGRAIAKPFAEGIDALMEIPGVFQKFQTDFVGPAMLLVTEKNASSPAPNGTSAAARNTARPARSPARTARTKPKRR